MQPTHIRLQWQADSLVRRYSTGVSLHSHTHHSREFLDFIYRISARSGLIDFALRHSRRRYGSTFDLRRCWWTPPLVPKAAWDLEREQIESALGLDALVSLTDHDNMEAPLSLCVLKECREFPVSVEWTVPVEGTFFHLGVHNLPVETARAAMAAFSAYTRDPQDGRLRELLEWLHGYRQVLVVLNHPLWDECEVGAQRHLQTLSRLLHRHGRFIHALEINGLRRWHENRSVAELARVWEKPLVSGGDRHGLEANTVLNLTNARTFSEFVEEVRQDGMSTILVTSKYRQSFFWRIVDTVLDVLGDHESHGMGWRTWSERIFYQCDDGQERSLAEIWGQQAPEIVWHFATMARIIHRSWLQRALRNLLFLEELHWPVPAGSRPGSAIGMDCGWPRQ